jgi:hypothetical protein
MSRAAMGAERFTSSDLAAGSNPVFSTGPGLEKEKIGSAAPYLPVKGI